MRPDIRHQVAEETAEEVALCQSRRERVMAYPDIAALLCRPPLSLRQANLWSGYIPPRYHQGKPNDSPIRNQLIAICKLVAEREAEAGPIPVAPELITDAQLTKLHTCLGEYGIPDKPDKLLYLTAETGHNVASSKDLTKAEASQIIDKLETLIRLEHEHNFGGIAETTEKRIDDDALTVEDQARRERGPEHPSAVDDGPDYPGDEPVAEYDGSAEDDGEPPY